MSEALKEDVWKHVVKRGVGCTVILNVCQTLAYQEKSSGVSQASGFLVHVFYPKNRNHGGNHDDENSKSGKRRISSKEHRARGNNNLGSEANFSEATGLILTNRHSASLGPSVVHASFEKHEMIQCQVVYSDPVHDFAFFTFRVKELRRTRLQKPLKLNPDGLKVGVSVLVIGNDDEERHQILSATVAKVNRAPPSLGDYDQDAHVFYALAASNTSCGSSGSPVLNRNAEVIALNTAAASSGSGSFYLPLGKIKSVLEWIVKRVEDEGYNCLESSSGPMVRPEISKIPKELSPWKERRLKNNSTLGDQQQMMNPQHELNRNSRSGLNQNQNSRGSRSRGNSSRGANSRGGGDSRGMSHGLKTNSMTQSGTTSMNQNQNVNSSPSTKKKEGAFSFLQDLQGGDLENVSFESAYIKKRQAANSSLGNSSMVNSNIIKRRRSASGDRFAEQYDDNSCQSVNSIMSLEPYGSSYSQQSYLDHLEPINSLEVDDIYEKSTDGNDESADGNKCDDHDQLLRHSSYGDVIMTSCDIHTGSMDVEMGSLQVGTQELEIGSQLQIGGSLPTELTDRKATLNGKPKHIPDTQHINQALESGQSSCESESIRNIIAKNPLRRGTLNCLFSWHAVEEAAVHCGMDLRKYTTHLYSNDSNNNNPGSSESDIPVSSDDNDVHDVHESCGVLLVDEIVTGSVAEKHLQAGDALISLDGVSMLDKGLQVFEILEKILDDKCNLIDKGQQCNLINRGQQSMGESNILIPLSICRGGETLELELPVSDLFDYIPNRILEIAGAIFHDVSFACAVRHHIKTTGVYIAKRGLLFARLGGPPSGGGGPSSAGVVILSVNSENVGNLREFETALKSIEEGEKFLISYILLDSGSTRLVREAQIGPMSNEWGEIILWSRSGVGNNEWRKLKTSWSSMRDATSHSQITSQSSQPPSDMIPLMNLVVSGTKSQPSTTSHTLQESQGSLLPSITLEDNDFVKKVVTRYWDKEGFFSEFQIVRRPDPTTEKTSSTVAAASKRMKKMEHVMQSAKTTAMQSGRTTVMHSARATVMQSGKSSTMVMASGKTTMLSASGKPLVTSNTNMTTGASGSPSKQMKRKKLDPEFIDISQEAVESQVDEGTENEEVGTLTMDEAIASLSEDSYDSSDESELSEDSYESMNSHSSARFALPSEIEAILPPSEAEAEEDSDEDEDEEEEEEDDDEDKNDDEAESESENSEAVCEDEDDLVPPEWHMLRATFQSAIVIVEFFTCPDFMIGNPSEGTAAHRRGMGIILNSSSVKDGMHSDTKDSDLNSISSEKLLILAPRAVIPQGLAKITVKSLNTWDTKSNSLASCTGNGRVIFVHPTQNFSVLEVENFGKSSEISRLSSIRWHSCHHRQHDGGQDHTIPPGGGSNSSIAQRKQLSADGIFLAIEDDGGVHMTKDLELEDEQPIERSWTHPPVWRPRNLSSCQLKKEQSCTLLRMGKDDSENQKKREKKERELARLIAGNRNPNPSRPGSPAHSVVHSIASKKDKSSNCSPRLHDPLNLSGVGGNCTSAEENEPTKVATLNDVLGAILIPNYMERICRIRDTKRHWIKEYRKLLKKKERKRQRRHEMRHEMKAIETKENLRAKEKQQTTMSKKESKMSKKKNEVSKDTKMARTKSKNDKKTRAEAKDKEDKQGDDKQGNEKTIAPFPGKSKKTAASPGKSKTTTASPGKSRKTAATGSVTSPNTASMKSDNSKNAAMKTARARSASARNSPNAKSLQRHDLAGANTRESRNHTVGKRKDVDFETSMKKMKSDQIGGKASAKSLTTGSRSPITTVSFTPGGKQQTGLQHIPRQEGFPVVGAHSSSGRKNSTKMFVRKNCRGQVLDKLITREEWYDLRLRIEKNAENKGYALFCRDLLNLDMERAKKLSNSNADNKITAKRMKMDPSVVLEKKEREEEKEDPLGIRVSPRIFPPAVLEILIEDLKYFLSIGELDSLLGWDAQGCESPKVGGSPISKSTNDELLLLAKKTDISYSSHYSSPIKSYLLDLTIPLQPVVGGVIFPLIEIPPEEAYAGGEDDEDEEEHEGGTSTGLPPLTKTGFAESVQVELHLFFSDIFVDWLKEFVRWFYYIGNHQNTVVTNTIPWSCIKGKRRVALMYLLRKEFRNGMMSASSNASSKDPFLIPTLDVELAVFEPNTLRSLPKKLRPPEEYLNSVSDSLPMRIANSVNYTSLISQNPAVQNLVFKLPGGTQQETLQQQIIPGGTQQPQTGDILFKLNNQNLLSVCDIEVDLWRKWRESRADSSRADSSRADSSPILPFHIYRRGKEQLFNAIPSFLKGDLGDRIVIFHGFLIVETPNYVPVTLNVCSTSNYQMSSNASCTSNLIKRPSSLYILRTMGGSPAEAAQGRIGDLVLPQVESQSVTTLDELKVVYQKTVKLNRKAALRMLLQDTDGRRKVVVVRIDHHYWPVKEFTIGKDGRPRLTKW